MADEKKLLDLVWSTEPWVGGGIGAILGVVLTLVVAFFTKLPQLIRQRLSIGRFMEGLLDNEQVCLMVVKTLHTGSISAQNPLGTGVMLSNVPNPVHPVPLPLQAHIRIFLNI